MADLGLVMARERRCTAVELRIPCLLLLIILFLLISKLLWWSKIKRKSMMAWLLISMAVRQV